ncbi:GNAT family protein [Reinekea marina]|uniref:GNAT family N-acetyltransferase n=1 Tax=Reinekea marina TaxID=1310421 RepID=A0ABV7WNB8_9GAMM|nr:GNAT family protein [Reinekea marina]MDN3647885.1 GNAT family protein [Reinekea marina]
MLRYKDIVLRKPAQSEAQNLYELMVSDEKWTEFNGPYFGYSRPSFEEFLSKTFNRLQEGMSALAIEYENRLIGTVTFYWEDKNTRWLEAGIVIFDSTLWGLGIGKKALVPWVTHIFDTQELERVGMTTWSGNPRMISSAQNVGFTIEGTLRKVRYHDGVYYDSVKLGVTRDEWYSTAFPT